MTTATTTLEAIYADAARMSYGNLNTALNEFFAGLSAAEKVAACRAFGICQRPRSGKHAEQLVRQRIVGRKDTAMRTDF